VSPLDGSAGWSENTRLKQAHFEMVATKLATVARDVIRREAWPARKFLYVDLTAGPGFGDAGEGSPLVFARLAEAIGLDWEGVLFEKAPAMAARLQEELDARDLRHRYTIRAIDHAQAAQLVADYPGTWPRLFGLIYFDPNGGGRIPAGVIRGLTSHPRFHLVDVLCHVSANGAYKRRPGGTCLSDDLLACGKRIVLIREPSDQWQWTVALLTNAWKRMPEFKALGFHRIDSPGGRAVLRRLELTVKELRVPEGQEQLPLETLW
jgi:hypothetical protein